ncbi:MAG TPA: D-2-hydroxyacid dehydrogenase [Dehalococcoidia bacterium]|nr:D-2-hydroxyacid dehydrogenase [Dehalococcoidia bacterium]
MPVILLPPDVAVRLRPELGRIPELEVVTPPEEPGAFLAPDVLDRVDAAFFNLGSGPSGTRRILGAARRATNLRWIHLGHSGVDDPVFEELIGRGVVVTNSAGANAEPIAQSALAGLLALNRGLPGWLDAQRRHAWEPDPDDLPSEQLPRELRGQTMVIFGLGSIGRYVAQFARAFGIRVIGVRRTPATPEDGVDAWAPPARLDEVLPEADILVLTAPLTSETRGTFDARRLDRLPAGAVVINVARGELVDEAALAERLASGRLGGAYLDVFVTEPLPAESPLWELPNVLISPHDSARSAGTQGRVDAIFLEELGRWLRGEDSPRRARLD